MAISSLTIQHTVSTIYKEKKAKLAKTFPPLARTAHALITVT